jgi:hypothetical protein
MPGVFAGACRLPPWVDGVWNFVSSHRPWPSGVCRNAISARTPSSPTTRSTQRPSTGPFSPQLESKFDEELGCGREVVNHDADVLHPLDRHVLYGNESRFEPQRQAPERKRSSREIFFESAERDINHTGAHVTAKPRAQPFHAEGPATGTPSLSQAWP